MSAPLFALVPRDDEPPPPVKLRPYQVAAIDAVFRVWSGETQGTLLVHATGLGKTVQSCAIMQRWIKERPGSRVLFLAHRDELIQQAARKIEAMLGFEPDIEKAEHRDQGYSPIVVGSIQTCYQPGRLAKFRAATFGLVVIDEVHHAASDSYLRVLEHFASVKRLGLTATPTRKDGRKLGAEWDSVAHEFNLRDAIGDGWLVPVRRKEVHVAGLTLDDVHTRGGDLVEGEIEAKVLKDEATVHSWARGILDAAPDCKRILCFTPGVQSSIRLVECLNRYRPDDTPEWAVHLDGETPQNERRMILAKFGRGEFRFLSNCGVLLEGYDEPTIDCVAMMRPTQSEVLYTQVIGRGTRALPGVIDAVEGDGAARRAAIEASAKPSVLAIDFTTNSRRHDLVTALTILAGDESEEIVRAASRELDADPALTIDRALERARKRAEAEAQRKAEEEARRRTEAQRAHVRAKARTITFDIDRDPDAFLGVNKYQVAHIARTYGAKMPTEKQRALLEKQGLLPPNLDSDEGRALARARLNQLFKRMEAGACSVKQAKILARYGLDTNMSIQAAGKALDIIAAANWKPTEAQLRHIEATCLPREPGSEG